MADWEEQKFNEIFDNIYATTKYRRFIDPGFGVRDLRRLLEALYVNDGNDQGGRGKVGDIVSAATIAAHEQVLAEWEKDLREKK
ncbi:MAG: hypothetical protein FWG35_05360 [Spirochaetaceae bacterium]|nr:hypothetical protein [Spirochaetaceae bacterium]